MKEFYIQDDGIRLHAKLDLPAEHTKCPLVILLHGLTGHMEEGHITALKDTMTENGFAVLRPELYGHGGSDGQFSEHTVFKWLGNIMTVTEYAKTLPFVTDLYLCGHSQGGLCAMTAAAMRPDDYKALIPLSPALVIPDGAKKGMLFGASFDPEHIPDRLIMHGQEISGNYLRTARMLHPEEDERMYRKPVLIIHGEKDETVDVRYAKEAAAAYADCRLVILPDDNHGYDLHQDLMKEAVKSFLLTMEETQ